MEPTALTPGPNRRQLLAALAAGAATTALAGCLSGGSEDAPTTAGDGGAGSGGSDGGDGDGATTASGDTGEPTATEAPPENVMPAEDFDCDGMADEATARYADPGDRFVCTFAYPESWFVRARDSPTSTGVQVNAPAAVSTGGYLYFSVVSQYYRPVAKDALQSLGDLEPAGTLTYGGEECWIGEQSSGDPGRVIQSVVIPDGTGTYRQLSVDTQNLSFEESCFDDARAVGESIIGSFQPK